MSGAPTGTSAGLRTVTSSSLERASRYRDAVSVPEPQAERARPTDAGPDRQSRSPRGAARRLDLLRLVTDDIAANGLADFSLRRAARACGTTHKVLLYHFGSGESLLAASVAELRARRIEGGMDAALSVHGATLADRVRALWPALISRETDALDQAMGLAMTDPQRYGLLVSGALEEYLPPLRALCPPEWDQRRKDEVAALILATLRGLVLTRRTSAAPFEPGPALAALDRALGREEAADIK